MAFSFTFTKTLTTPLGSTSAGVVYTADNVEAVDLSIPTATTDQLVNIAFTLANLKVLYILSDKAILLETNDGTAPTDALSIQANVPYHWEAGGYFSQPLGGNVTKIYITNVSGATATINIRVLEDSTP